MRHLNIDINKFDGESLFAYKEKIGQVCVANEKLPCDERARALSLSHFACVHEIVLHLDPEIGCCIRLFGIDYIKSFRLKFATCCTNYQWFILIRLLFATFCDMQLQIANA